MIKPKKIIVVGGNAAGPAAAAKAKRVNRDAEVLLFEAGDFISTGTCEIPYVLSGEIADHRDIIYFDGTSFELEKGVKVFTNHFVNSINTKEKFILVDDLKRNEQKKYEYDTLVLATGSTSKKVQDYSDELKNVFYLKSVKDLILIKDYLNTKNVKKVFIIGSGYIGLEAAEALTRLNKQVRIVEKEIHPMPFAEEEISLRIRKILDNHNVEFINGNSSTEPVFYENKVKAFKINGKFIETDMVLIGTGFKPNNYLASAANLKIGECGGIVTDRKLKTSDRFIYAAGDNIEVKNFVTGKNDYFPLAKISYNYGHVAGENAAGGNAFADPVIKNISVKIFDSFYSQVGLTSREATNSKLYYSSVSAETSNLVDVMPNSREVFGKIIYSHDSRQILGASFLGGAEVSGYADLISSLIYLKQPVDVLSKLNLNYTPPLSPYINLLTILGKKSS